jgi:hypothetical protein
MVGLTSRSFVKAMVVQLPVLINLVVGYHLLLAMPPVARIPHFTTYGGADILVSAHT